MPFSSYQMQRLLVRLWRWWAGNVPPPSHPEGEVERVEVTAGGSARSRGRKPPGAPAARAGGVSQGAAPLAQVRDSTRFAPAVEEERERRAGSLMDPPYPDAPRPSHIPKLRRKKATRREARFIGEGD